jgi:hypothetical protein
MCHDSLFFRFIQKGPGGKASRGSASASNRLRAPTSRARDRGRAMTQAPAVRRADPKPEPRAGDVAFARCMVRSRFCSEHDGRLPSGFFSSTQKRGHRRAISAPVWLFRWLGSYGQGSTRCRATVAMVCATSSAAFQCSLSIFNKYKLKIGSALPKSSQQFMSATRITPKSLD